MEDLRVNPAPVKYHFTTWVLIAVFPRAYLLLRSLLCAKNYKSDDFSEKGADPVRWFKSMQHFVQTKKHLEIYLMNCFRFFILFSFSPTLHSKKCVASVFMSKGHSTSKIFFSRFPVGRRLSRNLRAEVKIKPPKQNWGFLQNCFVFTYQWRNFRYFWFLIPIWLFCIFLILLSTFATNFCFR